MEVHVFGKQFIDFIADDGHNIKGYNLFVGFCNDRVEGLKTMKFFVSEDLGKKVRVDEDYLFSFDFNGRIQSINILNDITTD